VPNIVDFGSTNWWQLASHEHKLMLDQQQKLQQQVLQQWRQQQLDEQLLIEQLDEQLL